MRKLYYYDAGYKFFQYEIQPVLDILEAKGVDIGIADRNQFLGLENSVIFTNIPSRVDIEPALNKGNKIIQTTHSADSFWGPHWFNHLATVFCVTNELEYKAALTLAPKENIELTGMPYLDYYFKVKSREEITPIVGDGDYVLGLQLTHDSHGEDFCYSPDFYNRYYHSYPEERKIGRTVFKLHINHPHWNRESSVTWVDSPVEMTPSILKHSNGIYASHFSFMLIEASLLDKSTFICPENTEWLKVERSCHVPNWWSGFDWRGLEKEELRHQVKDWFPFDGKNSERVADVILRYL